MSREVRDAVAGEVPDYNGEEATSKVKISSEMDLGTESFKVIRGTDSFRVCGIDLAVPDGEDESLSLVMTDGTTKVADVVVSETDDGQRLVCSLRADAAVAVGRYKLRLVSHGIDPTAPLVTRTYPVTLDRAIAPEPTGPTITKVTSDGPVEDDHLAVSKNHVLGTGLALGEGDHVYLRLIDTDGTVLEDNSQDHRVASSTDAEITSGDSGFWPDDSEYPDGEWDEEGRTVKLRVVKADGTAAERRVYLDNGE